MAQPVPFNAADIKRRMHGATESLKHDFGGLRTGRDVIMAALLGAEHATRFYPMLMTAAGTIPPAKVLVLGVGVAGLQALATARRLGAVLDDQHRHAEVGGQAREDLADGVQAAPRSTDDDQLRHARR